MTAGTRLGQWPLWMFSFFVRGSSKEMTDVTKFRQSSQDLNCSLSLAYAALSPSNGARNPSRSHDWPRPIKRVTRCIFLPSRTIRPISSRPRASNIPANSISSQRQLVPFIVEVSYRPHHIRRAQCESCLGDLGQDLAALVREARRPMGPAGPFDNSHVVAQSLIQVDCSAKAVVDGAGFSSPRGWLPV